MGKLRDNIVALGLVQAVNLVIPLATAPYLTRVLGAKAYGEVAFVQLVMAYLVMLTDYGFTWSATQAVAQNREDRAAVSEIFSSTWLAQWVLSIFAVLLSIPFIIFIPWGREMFALGLLLILGNVLFPVWLFLGLERMREVALLQMLGRLLSLPLIFALVQTDADASRVLVALGGGAVVAGVGSMVWLLRMRWVNFSWPSWRLAMKMLRDGAGVFFSRVSISAYTTLTPILLGASAGAEQLAFFSLADKIRGAAQSVMSPISTALFPRMSFLYKRDVAGAGNLLRLSITFISLFSGTISVLLWVFAPWFVALLGGRHFSPAVSVLRWLAPLPFVIGLSNIFGVQVLLPNKMVGVFNRILGAACVLSLVLIWPMSNNFGSVGAAQTLLVAEIAVTLNMGFSVWRLGYLK